MQADVVRTKGRWERRRNIAGWGLAALLTVGAVVGWQLNDQTPGQADGAPDAVSGEVLPADATGAPDDGVKEPALGAREPGPIVSAVPVGEPRVPTEGEVAALEELEPVDEPVSADEEAELEELVAPEAEAAGEAPAQTEEELDAAIDDFLAEDPSQASDVQELEEAQEPVLDESVVSDLDAEAAVQDAELAEELADLPGSQP